MRKTRTTRWLIGLLLMQLSLIGADAATIEHRSYSQSVSATKTNWTQTLQLQQFDSSLGNLTGITIQLDSAVSGEVGVENLADVQSDVTLDLGADVSLQGSSLFLTSSLHDARTKTLGSFDGTLDWKKTLDNDPDPASGATYLDFMDIKTASTHIATGFDAFKGTGTLDFLGTARATSRTTDTNGNIASFYRTKASATATITYDYEVVPEPSSIIALGVCFTGLVSARSRRRRQAR